MPTTSIGGHNERFPATRWSAIVAARSSDAHERTIAFGAIVDAYWKPVYKYIRIRWHQSGEDAKDLTQGFFACALEKDFFQAFEPGRAAFRTFLRACVDGYVANEEKAAHRLKRGGDAQFLSLDFETAEGELRQLEIPDPTSVDDYFHKEWMRSLFSLAIDELRASCDRAGKHVHFKLFERYDLGDAAPGDAAQLTYEQLALEFGLSVATVTNYLAFTRREFRRIVLDKIRALTASDAEFRSEARSLFG